MSEALFARRRIAVALVATVLAFLYGVPAYFAIVQPIAGTYGWTVQANGIQSIASGSPAHRAGLHAGDRIVFSRISHADAYRIASGFGSRAGHRMPIVAQTREGLRDVVVVAERRPTTGVSALESVLINLQMLLFLAIGAFVALRRPDAVGLWFFAFATTNVPSGEILTFYSTLPNPAVAFGITQFWLASAIDPALFISNTRTATLPYVRGCSGSSLPLGSK
jgi:hypothetical protein